VRVCGRPWAGGGGAEHAADGERAVVGEVRRQRREGGHRGRRRGQAGEVMECERSVGGDGSSDGLGTRRQLVDNTF
jgi:hypothetical protein